MVSVTTSTVVCLRNGSTSADSTGLMHAGVFHGMMASIVDEPPERTIGTEVPDHFSVRVDYPDAAAWFLCDRDGTTAPSRSGSE